MKAPLSPDELIALIFLAVIAGAAVLYGVQKLVFAVLHRRADVNGSQPESPRPYVKSTPATAAGRGPSGPSRPEVEAEARREARPEGGLGIVSLTEKALQSRDAENYQRGLIDAYATLLKGGYLVAAVQGKKVGEMKQALAAVAGHRAPLLPGLGGRQLQALNAAIDAVPSPAAAELEPERTPVAGRELPAGVEFAGEC